MLKKNETIEILNNGGHITICEIYRSARVYDAHGDYIDTCRIDTAERIGTMEGYKDTRVGTGWEYTRRVELAEQPAQVEEIPAENLTADFGVRACVAEIENMTERGETAETIAADLIECDCEQGVFFNRKMWDAFYIVFPNFPVSVEILAEYWNSTKWDADHAARRAHVRRLINTHVAQAAQETQETAQADEQPEQEQQPAARVAVRDPETEEILEGSPRAIYHAIVYRVRYARRYWENSPNWEPVTENAARIIQAAHLTTVHGAK